MDNKSSKTAPGKNLLPAIKEGD
jgi:WD40 repeat protein